MSAPSIFGNRVGTGSTTGAGSESREWNKERMCDWSRAETSTGMAEGQTPRDVDCVWVGVSFPAMGSKLTSLRSFAVFVGEVSGQIGFELTVVGVDRGAQRGFGGIALAEALQDALYVAHAVGVVDIRHGS